MNIPKKYGRESEKDEYHYKKKKKYTLIIPFTRGDSEEYYPMNFKTFLPSS